MDLLGYLRPPPAARKRVFRKKVYMDGARNVWSQKCNTYVQVGTAGHLSFIVYLDPVIFSM